VLQDNGVTIHYSSRQGRDGTTNVPHLFLKLLEIPKVTPGGLEILVEALASFCGAGELPELAAFSSMFLHGLHRAVSRSCKPVASIATRLIRCSRKISAAEMIREATERHCSQSGYKRYDAMADVVQKYL